MSKKTSLICGMLRYLDDCALDEQSPRTIEGKRYEIRSFVRWHIIHHGGYLEDVCKASLDDYKRYLLTYRNSRTNAPIEKNTRRNKLKAVRIFCQSMVELGLIDENPALKVRVSRAPIKLVQAILQKDEMDAISAQTALHGLEGQRDWTILSVLFSCGLRAGEVTRLTISSVNFEVGMLFISHFLGPRTNNRETHTPYESGILSVGSARVHFHNHYFLYAIFFVIFDLEVLYLFAWAIAFREAGLLGFIEASIFIVVLFVALIYLWRMGALDLISRHSSRGRTSINKNNEAAN